MKILIALLLMSSMIMAENEKMKTDSTPVEDSSTVDIGYTDDIEQTYDKVKCKVSKELLQINETFQEKREEQSWLSIGTVSGVAAVDVESVNDLFEKESAYSDSPLYGSNIKIPGSTDYSNMFFSGGSIVFGVGNGLRLGFGGYGIYRSYDLEDGSDLYETTIASGYGGLLIQKGFVSGNHNFTTGVLVGAGGMAVGINKHEGVVSTSAFTPSSGDRYNHWDDDDCDFDEFDEKNFENMAHGGFGVGELNLAYTYSVLSFLHLGFEAKGTVKKSITVENDFGDYLTVDPSLGFKLMLGTLG